MVIDIIGNDEPTEDMPEPEQPVRWEDIEDLSLEIVPVEQPQSTPDEDVIRQTVLWNIN